METAEGVSADNLEEFPWPPAAEESVAEAAFSTWRGASLHPASFFRAMPARGPLLPALLYYLPLGVLVEGIDLFWTVVLGPVAPVSTGALARFTAGAGARPLIDFLLSPVYLLGGLFLTATVVHAALVILGAARHPFRATAKVVCYAYSPAVLAVIPRVGWLFASIWMVVLLMVGVRHTHKASAIRAAAAVLLPLLMLGFLLALVLLLAAVGGMLLLPVA